MAIPINSLLSTRTEAAKATRVVVPPRFEKRGGTTSRTLLVGNSHRRMAGNGKIKNPAWTSFKTGEVSAPGVENPLGSRWIGFWADGQDVIGFHGTSDVKSIGTAASHGCVRMRDRDVKALFPLVKVGTIVKVVNE